MEYISEDYCSEELSGMLMEKGYIGATNTYLGKDDLNVKQITLQSAMKWLREREWFICIIPLAFYCGEKAVKFGYNIWAGDNLEIDEFDTPKLNTYEEACKAAIKYCLKNLI